MSLTAMNERRWPVVRDIDERQTIRLTAEESRAFAEALLNPREPTADLKVAARRYMEILGG